MARQRVTARRGVLAAALSAVLVAALAGCGGGSSSGGTSTAGDGMPAPVPGTGRADLGSLHIRNAYIPQQASADVAAAYFAVTNDSRQPDRLVGVTSTAARSVSVHATVTQGGAEVMVPVASLAVPARGTALLSVAGRHLMLENPVHLLRQGDAVTLTLRFATAGTVNVRVPVVGYTGPAGMPGMDG